MILVLPAYNSLHSEFEWDQHWWMAKPICKILKWSMYHSSFDVRNSVLVLAELCVVQEWTFGGDHYLAEVITLVPTPWLSLFVHLCCRFFWFCDARLNIWMRLAHWRLNMRLVSFFLSIFLVCCLFVCLYVCDARENIWMRSPLSGVKHTGAYISAVAKIFFPF